MDRIAAAEASASRAQFSPQDTFAAKGVATLLLLTHHLFYEGASDVWGIRSLLSSGGLLTLGLFCKVCVSVFTLLSAYGMSVQYQKRLQAARLSGAPTYGTTVEFCTRRYLSLMGSFWFIFALSLLVTSFTYHSPLSVYGAGVSGLWNGFIDSLGLAHMFNTPTLNPTWWYMWVAIYVILLFPLLYRWCEKDGLIAFFASLIVLPFLSLDPPVLPSALLGICFAQRNLFVRLRALARTAGQRVLFGVLLLGALALLFLVRALFSIPYIIDAFLAPLIVLAAFFFFPSGSLMQRPLVFVGRHSSNIFLTHTFIFAYYGGRFIYGFRYPVLIMLSLLLCSLALSMLLELLKKVLRYDALSTRMRDKAGAAVRRLCARDASID
ncbi:MAG: acyltransferase family protein [Clostridia bacterium]|nr:acyltransferase family protein [Clostridia bacterium]